MIYDILIFGLLKLIVCLMAMLLVELVAFIGDTSPYYLLSF